MKKAISILLSVVVCLTFAACGTPNDNASSVITETQTIIIKDEATSSNSSSSEDTSVITDTSSEKVSSKEETPQSAPEPSSDTTFIDDFLNDDGYKAKDYAYSFAVVGDTQYLVQNDVNWGVNNTATLYEWIIANKDAKKIKAVFGMGDITEKNDPAQWQHAKTNISKLNGVLPYYLARGNHDSADSLNLHFNVLQYTSQFNDPDISDQSKCFYQKDKIENAYTKFTVGSTKYLVLMLDYRAYDNVLAWANEVVAANPDYRVIVTTHDYLGVDGSWDTEKDYIEENSGRDIWVEFIRKHKNIFLVLCGHISKYPNSDIIKFECKGDNGNSVTQLMINSQSLEWDDITTTEDDNDQQYGMVTMLYFNEDGSEVMIENISTVMSKAVGYDYYYRDSANNLTFYPKYID